MLNKNLIILTICQVFSFTAPPITVFISGIVGLKISPIASLATLPTSLSIVGTAVFSFFAAKIMSKIGRKKGFILSSTYSSIASLLGAYSIYTENFILFCISCFVIGTGIAFTHQYRFAAAETVEKNDSSRAISILLLATILSASMMFERSFNLTKEAEMIRKIVSDSIEKKIVTEDLAENNKSFSTSQVGDWIKETIEKE